MKMLRQLPQLLRFIPGTAQDVRAYFLTLQYWLAGSRRTSPTWSACWSTATPKGRARPARHAEGRAAGRLSRCRRSTTRASTGRVDGAAGATCRGPGARHGRAAADASATCSPANAGHYDGVIAAFEARGLRVIPAFASGLDNAPGGRDASS